MGLSHEGLSSWRAGRPASLAAAQIRSLFLHPVMCNRCYGDVDVDDEVWLPRSSIPRSLPSGIGSVLPPSLFLSPARDLPRFTPSSVSLVHLHCIRHGIHPRRGLHMTKSPIRHSHRHSLVRDGQPLTIAHQTISTTRPTIIGRRAMKVVADKSTPPGLARAKAPAPLPKVSVGSKLNATLQ